MLWKVLTIGFLALGVGLIVLWPWLVGSPPQQNAPLIEREGYAVRSASVAIGSLLSIMVAGVCSYILVKVTQRNVRKESKENIRKMLGRDEPSE
ncbi:MAG: hypothetical protein ACK4P3_03175 [Fimbriimonadaceae bacterium]